MPSRKKDRGKQRKAAKQNSNARAPQTTGASDGPGITGVRLSPQGTLGRDKLESGIGEFMALGCRIIMCDDGSSTVRHPCFDHVHNKDMGNFLDIMRNFERELLNDDQRKELAENYARNYAQDLRKGDFHGTRVIICNIADPHLGPQLADELLKAGIHLSLLHFLNQSDESVSDVLGRAVDAGGSTKLLLPHYWVGILGMFIGNGSEDARLAVAKGIEPFLMSVIDDKRELFQSNHVWHLCLTAFFDIVLGIMKSKEGFSVMISYEGLLPFVAQASCWGQSREDIVAERDFFRFHHLCDSSIAPAPIGEICYDALRAIASIFLEHDDVVEEAEMREALDQIACAPLLSNDPNCTDSTMAGFVRMMAENIDKDSRSILWYILQPLLFKYEYVDARVISEFIEYGRRNSSMVAAQTVLKTVATILGRNDSFKRIKMIESRYAAVIRHGMLEFCIDALVAYGNESGCDIAQWLYYIAMGVWSMALHSKTSRALRERQAEILTALDVLRDNSTAFQTRKIRGIIAGAVGASFFGVCCNCLKLCARKEILFCKRCVVECYCSPACQSESFAMGHDELCKKEVHHSCELKGKDLSETELKRLEVLKCNLMVNGCRFMRKNAADFLGKDGNVEEVRIDFEECPPAVEVSRRGEGECSDSCSLKCTFRAPVYYGFAEKADLEEVIVGTSIPRRSLDVTSGSIPAP